MEEDEEEDEEGKTYVRRNNKLLTEEGNMPLVCHEQA